MADAQKALPWIDFDGTRIREVRSIDCAWLLQFIRDQKIFRGRRTSLQSRL